MLLAILIPVIFAFFIPLLSKYKSKVHTGIFVFFVPFAIFIYFARFIGANFQVKTEHLNWIPSLQMKFDFQLDGLSLLFVLLISGIGSLVVLFSIFYMHYNEQLKQFYIYLLMFMTVLLVVYFIGIGSLFVLYSIFYLHYNEQLKQFYIYLLMFMTAMLGVVLSDNVFVLYTFWELTSISSFLLIGYWHFKERSRYGALKSL